MSRSIARSVAAGSMVLSAAMSAMAQGDRVRAAEPVDAPVQAEAVKVRYDGDKLVRVFMRDGRDVRVMNALSQDPWTCGWDGVTPGEVDFRVSAEAFEALTASTIPFRVLNGDIQTAIDAERAQFVARDAAWFADYKSYAQVDAYLDSLVALRPDLASRVTVGNSLEGRAIPGIRISSGAPGAKPGVVMISCQHAREWITVMSTVYCADQLVTQYASSPAIQQIVDNYEVFIIPIVNPDGYVYTWGPDRLWRKNRRQTQVSPAMYGVDLNRNWGKGFGGEGSSGSLNSETYRGPSAFSEPCTTAVRNFINARPNVAFFFDVHSYSQLVLAPWGDTFALPSDTRAFDQYLGTVRDAIFGKHGQVFYAGPTYRGIYPASGGSADWVYFNNNAMAIAMELRDTGSSGFILPASQIVPSAEEWFEGFKAGMQWGLANPVAINFPHERPTTLASDAGTNVLVQFNRGLKGVASSPANPPMVHSRTGTMDGFTAAPLGNAGSDESGQLYQHTLNAGACGSVVQWYYTVQASDGSTVTFPPGGAGAPYQAVTSTFTVVRSDDFESSTGWFTSDTGDNAGGGLWIRTDPTGYNKQAEYDHTPLGGTSAYVTGDGSRGVVSNYVFAGKTTLKSPVMNLSGATNAEVSFWLWFNNSRQVGNDPFRVDVTNNATAGAPTWVTAVNIAGTAPPALTAMTNWRKFSFKVQDFVAPTSTVQVRFVASHAFFGAYVEAGVDDFLVRSYACSQEPCAGDFNGDGTKSVEDLFFFLARWFSRGAGSDYNHSDAVSVQDLFDFLSDWFMPCP